MSATPNVGSVCDCGHLEVAHEVAVRDGKAWFAIDALPVQEANEQDRVWWYCGHCEDGCYLAQNDGSEAAS